MLDWIDTCWNLFARSSDRIIWNLFLAFIPLVLSYYLFRPLAIRNLVWWLLLVVFAAFLPNAPYILTDSIHIIELSQQNYPLWAIVLVLIPQYTMFITVGFVAYVICLIRLDNYIDNLVAKQYLSSIDGFVHLLCVVGIYLGRFERFNSWDLVTKPREVIAIAIRDLLDPGTLFSIAIAFLAIWLLSELIKLVNSSFVLNNSKHD